MPKDADTKTFVTYHVTWEVELDAKDGRDAARQAQEMMRDPASIATIFLVHDLKTDQRQVVDLGDGPSASGREEKWNHHDD